ncbi:hypothetical protein FSP39_025393 [Pinctada imbricata]|uniref:TatD n=1 Tax=Pinctada imbricata TaxID=66713 RepID=A0AA88XSX2_PINIB|nr:hypothetical protein FSP39_025393 [Pinctada imbricata]
MGPKTLKKTKYIKFPKVKDMREEGEAMLPFLQRMGESETLLGPGSLGEALWTDPRLTVTQIEEGWVLQYGVALRRHSPVWIRLARRECIANFSAAWVDANLPSLDGTPIQIKKGAPGHSGSPLSEVLGTEMVRDVRLDKDPTLPILQAVESRDEPVANATSLPDDSEGSMGTPSEEADTNNNLPEPVMGEEGGIREQYAPVLSLDPEDEGFLVDNLYSGGSLEETSKMEVQENAQGTTPECLNSVSTCVLSNELEDSQAEASVRQVSVGEAEDSGEQLQVKVTYKGEAASQSSGELASKGVPCPFNGCHEQSTRLIRHVYRNHIPPVFASRIQSTVTVEVLDKQKRALVNLVEAALGQEVTLEEAMEHVNSSGEIPNTTEISPEVSQGLLARWKNNGWAEPDRLSLRPVNSPIALFHWRCLAILVNRLSPEICSEWQRTGLIPQAEGQTASGGHSGGIQVRKRSGASKSVGPQGDAANPKVPRVWTPLVMEENSEEEGHPCRSLVPAFRATAALPVERVYQAFDSHFHLDRTSARWREPLRTVENLISQSWDGRSHPRLKVDLVGGVMVHCDPKTYPARFDQARRWGYAIGIHPKKVREFNTEKEAQFSRLLGFPRVVAIGEVGLDRSCDPESWPLQDEALFKVLKYVRPNKVLVLHLRGMPNDIFGYETSLRCLGILVMAGLDRKQPIHLHCFTGSRVMVQRWLEVFPNTYFGFTALVQEFNIEQCYAIRSVPQDKLLVETDSPYLSPTGQAINTPAYIGDVASSLADKLDLSTREVLNLTVENGKRLYKL